MPRERSQKNAMRKSDVAPHQPAEPTPEAGGADRRRGAGLARWVWPLLVAGVIFYASSRSLVGAPGGIKVNDKLAHFCAYGLLASLVLRAFGGGGWRGAVAAVLIASAYGASDEWHQSFVPGRNSELADWVADTAGAALAVALYLWCAPYRRLLEAPLGRRKAT
jgi:VanZ family protein